MPDVFEESIFPSATRLEFFAAEECVIDLSAEMPLEPPHDFRKELTFRVADHQDINVTCGVLLVSSERTVEVCLTYSSDFFRAIVQL